MSLDQSHNEHFFLTKKIRDYIEENYYHDLNVPEKWDTLLYSSLENHEDVIDNIEHYAENGIANLHHLIHYHSTYFKLAYHAFAPAQLHQHINLLRWYAELLCYFFNCYDKTKNKCLLDLQQVEKLAFLYGKDKETIFTLIEKEHATELALITKLLLGEETKNLSSIELLRDLIALPFLLIESLPLEHNIFFDQHSLKQNIQSLINTKLSQHDLDKKTFHWLDQVKEDFFLAVFATIEIFEVFKKIHLLCGATKSYGYYQKLLDEQSGFVLYSIPYQGQMYLIKSESTLIAGRTNISSLEILPDKAILINFKQGTFFDDSITSQAAFSVALAINDMFPNMSELFYQFSRQQPSMSKPVHVLLESAYDNPEFTERVKKQLQYFNPINDDVIRILPSLKFSSAQERDRYLFKSDDIISTDLKQQIIENIKLLPDELSTHLSEVAFQYVKLIELNSNEILIKEGDASGFVYIPFSEGLEGQIKHGQMRFFPKAWMPVGHVGVIQSDRRTATILAKSQVKLLMIPGQIYLNYWHVVFTVDELRTKILRSDEKTS